MAGTQELEHMRQHDRVGQTVRRMVLAAQLMRDGVDVAHIGPRERQAGVRRRQRHLLARREIPAVPVRDAQVLVDHADRRERHPIRVAGRPLADECLDGVGQRVHAGCRGHMTRQPGHQRGIERGHRRHETRVGDHQLLVGLRVRNHGGHGHLGPSARGGRHRVDRCRRVQPLEIPDQLPRMLPVRDCQRNRLRRVHRRAAAERHDGIAALLLVERDPLLDQRDRRIRRDRVEHDVRRAALGQRPDQRVRQAHAGDRGSVTIRIFL